MMHWRTINWLTLQEIRHALDFVRATTPRSRLADLAEVKLQAIETVLNENGQPDERTRPAEL